MALSEENGGGGMFTMPVTPAYGGGMGGFGNFGSDGWWIILLFVLLGGWGNNGGGFGGGMGGLYPWLNQSNQINDGFRDQMLNDNISGIRDGIYANQLANLERSFAEQTANTAGLNAIQAQLAQCCCENRTTSLNNTRDIIDSQTRGTQAILDKLCALELDGVKGQLAAAQRETVGLQNQLNMANLAASQTAQTVNIRDSIIDELRSCPIPSQPVYGSQPIFTCPNNNNGCGCGGNF